MTEVSVIVPVYNMAGDGKLAFCLDSLLAQTLENIEIIAVDDASTDDSLQVLRDYETKNPGKIKVITYPENRHQGGARNAGLKAVQGKWIGFLDSDDWVAPDYLEKLVKRGEETGADVVGCTYNLVDRHTYEVGQIAENNNAGQSGVLDVQKRKELIKDPGSCVTKIYLASLIRDNDLSFPENIFYEDNAAGPIWSMYYTHFEYIDEPLYYYYQHDTSTVHTITVQRCLDRLEAGEILLSEMKKRGFFKEYYSEIENVFTTIYFTNTVFSYMRIKKGKKLSLIKHIRRRMLEEFPDFRKNPSYGRFMDEEQKKYTDLCMRSPLIFFVKYSLLWKIRDLRSQ